MSVEDLDLFIGQKVLEVLCDPDAGLAPSAETRAKPEVD